MSVYGLSLVFCLFGCSRLFEKGIKVTEPEELVHLWCSGDVNAFAEDALASGQEVFICVGATAQWRSCWLSGVTPLLW